VDELGWFFDARQFANVKSNEFRKTLLAFPRKVESYIIVASRLVVDASFRALSIQRTWAGFGVAQYGFAESEGAANADGYFWVTGMDALYSQRVVGKVGNLYSDYYASRYIPSGIDFLREYVSRCMAAARDTEEYDPNDYAQEGWPGSSKAGPEVAEGPLSGALANEDLFTSKSSDGANAYDALPTERFRRVVRGAKSQAPRSVGSVTRSDYD